jgi:hypothetical protein
MAVESFQSLCIQEFELLRPETVKKLLLKIKNYSIASICVTANSDASELLNLVLVFPFEILFMAAQCAQGSKSETLRLAVSAHNKQQGQGARYLMGENLKVVSAEFSTLS